MSNGPDVQREAGAITFALPVKTASLVAGMVKIASTDSRRPVLQTVEISWVKSKVTFAATDTYKLAVLRVGLTPASDDVELVEPGLARALAGYKSGFGLVPVNSLAAAINAAVKIAKRERPSALPIVFTLTEGICRVEVRARGEVLLFTTIQTIQQTDGQYPKWASLIPAHYATEEPEHSGFPSYSVAKVREIIDSFGLSEKELRDGLLLRPISNGPNKAIIWKVSGSGFQSPVNPLKDEGWFALQMPVRTGA